MSNLSYDPFGNNKTNTKILFGVISCMKEVNNILTVKDIKSFLSKYEIHDDYELYVHIDSQFIPLTSKILTNNIDGGISFLAHKS